MNKKVFIGLFLCGMLSFSNAGFITTTTSTDATALANALAGSGITISNAHLTGGSVSSGLYQNATVEAQGTSILQKGVVLSSGSILNLNTNGVNTNDGITGDLGLGGDASLNALIPGYTTFDATSLDFDFTAKGTTGQTVDVSFYYVFGSDEYDEYVNSSFNDVFGFFMDETNYALIPGTSTTVSINNVNADQNSSYFNQNDLSVGAPFASEMDGFTKPLVFHTTVDANSTHHMKLAIADAGDHVLDSWVLLGGESFVNQEQPPESVPEPSCLSLILIGLMGIAAKITFSGKKRN